MKEKFYAIDTMLRFLGCSIRGHPEPSYVVAQPKLSRFLHMIPRDCSRSYEAFFVRS